MRWCTLRSPDKKRPVLILTRTSAVDILTGITVAPITSTIRSVPSYVLLTPEEDQIAQMSAVNLDNVQTVQKRQIGPLITTLSTFRMDDVDSALCFALGVDRHITK